jgi:hypothetical protein
MADLPAKRGLVFLALTILCIMWMLIAFGTNVFSIKPDNGNGAEQWSDIWYSCGRGATVLGNSPVASCTYLTDKNLDCTKLEDRVRAMRAFYILTAVFCVVNLMFGVLDHFGKLEGLPFGLKSQIVLVVCAALVIFWSLLSWAIAISYPRSEYDCGGSSSAAVDQDGFKWGASAFMMLMLFITAIVQLVLALIFPGGGGGANEPTK